MTFPRISFESLRCFHNLVDAARTLEILPVLSILHTTAMRQRGAELRPHLIFSGEKARQKLAIVYKTVLETLKDLAENFRSRGWLRHLDGLQVIPGVRLTCRQWLYGRPRAMCSRCVYCPVWVHSKYGTRNGNSDRLSQSPDRSAKLHLQHKLEPQPISRAMNDVWHEP